MLTKNQLNGLIIVGVALAVGYWIGYDHGAERSALGRIDSFEECAAAGYPVMESYPAQCRTPDGRHFVQDVEEGVFCTADAKLCPDGSYVGRIAPDCRFAPCPGER
jgi:hypothetical protein